jgi:oxygen-dependent protoporphyrinogen oxidase
VNAGLPRVVIAGAGITGMSAAFHLQSLAKARRQDLAITVIEADDRIGGKIQTRVRDGFVLEQGPDSFLARKSDAVAFIEDVGLGDQCIRSRTGQGFIWTGGRLHPIPAGIRMGIPTRLPPLLGSSLFSPWDKLRLIAGGFRHRDVSGDDQPAGRYLRRRFGDALVDRLIEPVLGGIYGGKVDDWSLHAILPQLGASTARSYGSRDPVGSRPRPAATTRTAGGQGPFLTLEGGLQTLVTRAAAHLQPGSILKHARLKALEIKPDGYRLFVEHGRVLDADAVVLALPSPAASQLSPMMERIFQPLQKTPPASVVLVTFAFRESDISAAQDGIGFLVPRGAGLALTACTWSHSKWPHAAPRGVALLRCCVGGDSAHGLIGQPDQIIAEAVLRDLKWIMAIRGAAIFYRVTRWADAIPQYPVGHAERVRRVRSTLAEAAPGVFIAGASYDGVGLPDCIRQGKAAAHRALDHLGQLAWQSPAHRAA